MGRNSLKSVSDFLTSALKTTPITTKLRSQQSSDGGPPIMARFRSVSASFSTTFCLSDEMRSFVFSASLHTNTYQCIYTPVHIHTHKLAHIHTDTCSTFSFLLQHLPHWTVADGTDDHSILIFLQCSQSCDISFKTKPVHSSKSSVLAILVHLQYC